MLTTATAAVPGTAVLCLIRPEAIRLSAGARVNYFAATVGSTVYLGGRHDCELALGEGLRLRADLPANAATPAHAPGETVGLVIAPEDIVVLPG